MQSPARSYTELVQGALDGDRKSLGEEGDYVPASAAKASDGSCGDENTLGGLTELWTGWRNTGEKSFYFLWRTPNNKEIIH